MAADAPRRRAGRYVVGVPRTGRLGRRRDGRVSFFDERDNPSGAAGGRERPPRDASTSSSGTGSGRPPPRGPSQGRGGRGTDRQTVARRRLIGIGGGVLIVILAALLIRGCLDAREERTFDDYVQEVSSVVAESGQESEALFELLEDPGDLGAVDVQNTLNGLSVDAQRLVERAESADPPDELTEAQELVIQTLELRRDGLSGIAEGIPGALGDEQQDEAIEAIAADMQSFLASDVIYSQQAKPRIEDALAEQDLEAEVDELPDSQFLPDIELLEPATVSDAVDQIRTDGADEDEKASPGLHGTGLGEVAFQPSGETLVEGAATEVALGPDLALDVGVENQGDNDESDVAVTATIEGSGAPIELEGSLDTIAAGAAETVSLPLEEAPPTGEELDLTVAIEPVPGEEVADNNEGAFTVLFVE